MKWTASFEELQETHPYFLTYRTVPLFTPDECAQIIKFSESIPLMESHLRWGDHDEGRRDTDIFWLYPNTETIWIFQRIAAKIAELNKYWNFSLDGQISGLQLGRYGVGDGYDWHYDFGENAESRRKISIVVQLTDPALYQGGGLEFFRSATDVISASRDIGTITAFPSFMLHRAGKIVAGERWSLVTWLEGAPFR